MNSAARSGGSGALLVQYPPQVTARHEPHRDEQRAVGLAGLVDRDDVRVIDRGRRPGLGDEPAPERRVRRQRRREDLQRHQPAQPLVAGPEHHRHPARADLGLQPVPASSEPARNPASAGKSSLNTPPLAFAALPLKV